MQCSFGCGDEVFFHPCRMGQPGRLDRTNAKFTWHETQVHEDELSDHVFVVPFDRGVEA